MGDRDKRGREKRKPKKNAVKRDARKAGARKHTSTRAATRSSCRLIAGRTKTWNQQRQLAFRYLFPVRSASKNKSLRSALGRDSDR
jgi:hypothetical protein